MRLRVAYEGRVAIRIEGGDAEAFRRSALYKLRMPALRHLVDVFEVDVLRMRDELTHGDLERLLACLEEHAGSSYELV